MDNWERLFYIWLSGRISGSEYFWELGNFQKPWDSTKWKQIREILLKLNCEKCGSTDRLTLAHNWHPEKIAVTYARIAATFDPDYQDNLKAYIDSFKSEKGFKRPDLKRYKAEPTETDLYLLERDFLVRNYFRPDFDSEIGKQAIKEQFLLSRRYWSMIDTQTLCIKCSFHVDKKKSNI